MLGKADPSRRLAVLDGWRAVSILLVMAGHLLPIGPSFLKLNAAVAASGMALFFTLSGFLIVRFLMAKDDVPGFLIRRAARILPLAWLAMALALIVTGAPWGAYPSHFLFLSNLPGFHLIPEIEHFWSLCVEVQFYVGVAALVGLFGRRGLYALPVICLAVTAHRIAWGAHLDFVTWRRVDEILAGCTLALLHGGWLGERPARWLGRLNPHLLMPLLLASAHAEAGALNYLRPYIAMALVGSTLYAAPRHLARVLEARSMAYVAQVSFALYVIHGMLMSSWLGTGDKLVKYAKRPLLIAASFALAHLSTFGFENRFIALGHRFASRGRPVNSVAPAASGRRA
ncbi:acyltransferase family protein [Muricoccus aerilatus]|uniref:acyltransferase family protein n=1 Tax=Muricoccus aerilatus TaxID=452982 RepID=UPI0005C22E19|nr:acyltransferase [Roseomonas aerilata]